MDVYVIILVVLGVITLLTAWLPLVLKNLPLSLPIFCIGFGVVFAWLPLPEDAIFNPLEHRYVTERVTEFVVLIALMGAGLKLDRVVGWRSWNLTWRLLIIAMPLTIFAIAAVAHWLLGLSLAAALLLGAALAPTDPVLASDVQVGPPRSGEEDEVRFALTSEAGLNDGLSFPFVHLAIGLALWQAGQAFSFSDWVLVDVIWKLVAGVAAGWTIGWLLGLIIFKLPKRSQLSRTGDGFVALGATFLTYGVTELVHGYGFVAVFVAALALRSVERGHKYHDDLHNFTEQIERLMMMLVLFCFGLALAKGAIFTDLSWQVVLAAVVIVLLIRPAAAGLSLIGSGPVAAERAVIAFFGIRGLGSIYYLAYASGQADFDHVRTLWQTLFLVVLLSILIHGLSVTPVMQWLDRGRNR
ncbi:sodium/hydrogen exchanger family protein [Asticcacaulis biprosthecium C19]|uniref:Sodium/hydrogen exchanger family protein n=1 Tax=Asticcacaulis biprosthecium C19 TaxID=715226 RepID=F4QH86_9CAUL|nr:cation:proton antiporter [Asticcacaulis biprosthecium]EGF92623.1 sodium/hydrogen exchanger family protein [Asticcacaulis biprosthecium C19]